MTFKDKYPVFVLDITLIGMPSPVWRQVAVRTGTSMRELHHIIQAIMPWQTYHLYEFSFQRGGDRVQIGDTQLWQEDMALENDDRLFYVEDIFRVPGDKVIYTYDMGDDWRHEVKLLEIRQDPFEFPVLPCVLGAKGICPPEDSGGVHGFSELMKVASDFMHPDLVSACNLLEQLGWSPIPPKVKKFQNALNKYKTVMWKQYVG